MSDEMSVDISIPSVGNSTLQNENQSLELQGSVHHPYCSAHYKFGTVLNDCICDEFRASYKRGIQHGLLLAEAAILELHRQVPGWKQNGPDQCEYCASLCHSLSGLYCEDEVDGEWPCLTVRTIAALKEKP